MRFSRFDSYHAENAPASAFISSIGENENLRAFVSTISSVAGLFACGISVISSDETIKLYIYGISYIYMEEMYVYVWFRDDEKRERLCVLYVYVRSYVCTLLTTNTWIHLVDAFNQRLT